MDTYKREVKDGDTKVLTTDTQLQQSATTIN